MGTTESSSRETLSITYSLKGTMLKYFFLQKTKTFWALEHKIFSNWIKIFLSYLTFKFEKSDSLVFLNYCTVQYGHRGIISIYFVTLFL